MVWRASGLPEIRGELVSIITWMLVDGGIRYKLLVTFSAGNLARIAESLPDCFIVADRDAPTEQVPEPGGMGLKVALESKRPFWIADEEGIDFNDYARNVGMFKASQALRSAMR